MINKCRIKIVQKELYNVRDSQWVKDRKNYRRNYCSNLNGICNCLQLTSLDPTESEFIHTNLSGFCLIIFQTYFIHCPIHQGLVLQSTLYKFVVLCSLGLYPFTYQVWASKHVPTYIYIYIYIYKPRVFGAYDYALQKYQLLGDFDFTYFLALLLHKHYQ